MTRTMQDSVNVHALIPGADLYAGYVDGHYANADAIAARFPGKHVVRITVLGTTLDAHVADVESGDLKPASGAAWAKRKHVAGAHPTLYCSTSMRPAVEAECHKLGLELHRDYEIWEAHYDNVAQLPTGAVAKQYRDHGPHGENVDMSVVADYWPGVDPHPTPRTVPAWFTRSLYVHSPAMRGHDVARVQQWLIAHEFLASHDHLGHTNADGIYGPMTGAAVRRAKIAHHLPADTHTGRGLAIVIG